MAGQRYFSKRFTHGLILNSDKLDETLENARDEDG